MALITFDFKNRPTLGQKETLIKETTPQTQIRNGYMSPSNVLITTDPPQTGPPTYRLSPQPGPNTCIQMIIKIGKPSPS